MIENALFTSGNPAYETITISSKIKLSENSAYATPYPTHTALDIHSYDEPKKATIPDQNLVVYDEPKKATILNQGTVVYDEPKKATLSNPGIVVYDEPKKATLPNQGTVVYDEPTLMKNKYTV